MYYVIKWRGSSAQQGERMIDALSLSEAVTFLDGAIREKGGASLWQDGREIMHGHIVGTRAVITWRD